MSEGHASAATIRRRGFLLVLSSPSGAGKTTITRRLLERDPSLSLSVSVTTRPRRMSSEIDGRDYHFIDQGKFDRMVAQGELLEHATVFGHSYGTPGEPIEASLAAGRDIVTDIDWQGTQQLSRSAVKDDLVTIFVLPPSVGALEARLRTRAQDSDEVVAARLAKSADEMSHWAEYRQYIVIMTIWKSSVAQAEAIVFAERSKGARQVGLADFCRPAARRLMERKVPPDGASTDAKIDLSVLCDGVRPNPDGKLDRAGFYPTGEVKVDSATKLPVTINLTFVFVLKDGDGQFPAIFRIVVTYRSAPGAAQIRHCRNSKNRRVSPM